MKKTQTPQEMSSVELGKQLIEEKERKDAVAAEAKQTRELTIAERLIESVTCDVVKVPMKDSRGDYHILCRKFTWEEQTKLQKALAGLRKAADLTAEKAPDLEAVQTMFLELIAYPTGVCLQPELNMEFWKAGKFGQEVPTKIFAAVGAATKQSIIDAQSFRNKRPGPNSA
jgi:hypothetical protein